MVRGSYLKHLTQCSHRNVKYIFPRNVPKASRSQVACDNGDCVVYGTDVTPRCALVGFKYSGHTNFISHYNRPILRVPYTLGYFGGLVQPGHRLVYGDALCLGVVSVIDCLSGGGRQHLPHNGIDRERFPFQRLARRYGDYNNIFKVPFHHRSGALPNVRECRSSGKDEPDAAPRFHLLSGHAQKRGRHARRFDARLLPD